MDVQPVRLFSIGPGISLGSILCFFGGEFMMLMGRAFTGRAYGVHRGLSITVVL